MKLKITEIDWDASDCEYYMPIILDIKARVETKINQLLQSSPNAISELWQKYRDEIENAAFSADVIIRSVPRKPTKKYWERVEFILDRLSLAIALLAFNPGGVPAFGWRFEAKFDGSQKT